MDLSSKRRGISLRLLALGLIAVSPLLAQFGKNADAGRIRGKQVQDPLIVSNNCVTIFIAAHNQFECQSGGGILGSGISGSASLTFPLIASGTWAIRTFAIAGATVGDQVLPLWPVTLEPGITGVMRVIASNTIEARLFNTNGFSVTPAVQVFGATVGIGAAPARASLTFPPIPSGATRVQTFSYAGALTNQKVIPAWPSTLEAGLLPSIRVSGPNLIEVSLFNMNGFSVTPAVQVFGGALI